MLVHPATACQFGDPIPAGRRRGGHPLRKQKIAAGFRGEEAFEAGVSEEQALETVLPHLNRERCADLAEGCLELYLWDRMGSDN